MRQGLGLLLLMLSRIVNHLIVILVGPNDLIKLTKKNYNKGKAVFELYGSESDASGGLSDEEKEQINKSGLGKNSRVLVLGCGGGRESIALAKRGFSVTAIDSERKMIEAAKKNARINSVIVDFKVKDMLDINFPKHSFEGVVLFGMLYGMIPGRKRRINLLKRMHLILVPEGKLIMDIPFKKFGRLHRRFFWLGKLTSYLTLGNLEYQLGDTIAVRTVESYPYPHFLHYFQNENALISEAREGGFKIEGVEINNTISRGYIRLMARLTHYSLIPK